MVPGVVADTVNVAALVCVTITDAFGPPQDDCVDPAYGARPPTTVIVIVCPMAPSVYEVMGKAPDGMLPGIVTSVKRGEGASAGEEPPQAVRAIEIALTAQAFRRINEVGFILP